MYKPNFCADCGAQIVRARWYFWTSKRFCDECGQRLRKLRLQAPLIAGLVLFSAGLLMGRSTRPVPPPLIVTQGQPSVQPSIDSNTDGKSNSPPKSELTYGPDGTQSERPTDTNEVVSICGARTKKGTPCSRRVRGTGRCWQHKGMNASLPVEKLVVEEK
jgi:hypothetical protein